MPDERKGMIEKQPLADLQKLQVRLQRTFDGEEQNARCKTNVSRH
jgi:hypothetical protein